MPPEQATGGEATPRSERYSLGAMLYEMVTGRPPFLGDDSVAIIGQHINTPPVAPTWHNSECPRALDALILRLLAKDPSERPESATDVLSALEAIGLLAPVEERAVEANALDSLAGGVFVGQQREMGELKVALEDAQSGHGRPSWPYEWRDVRSWLMCPAQPGVPNITKSVAEQVESHHDGSDG